MLLQKRYFILKSVFDYFIQRDDGTPARPPQFEVVRIANYTQTATGKGAHISLRKYGFVCFVECVCTLSEKTARKHSVFVNVFHIG